MTVYSSWNKPSSLLSEPLPAGDLVTCDRSDHDHESLQEARDCEQYRKDVCNARVSDEDSCGNAAVATDLGSEEPRCSQCVDEQRNLWDPYRSQRTALKYAAVQS